MHENNDEQTQGGQSLTAEALHEVAAAAKAANAITDSASPALSCFYILLCVVCWFACPFIVYTIMQCFIPFLHLFLTCYRFVYALMHVLIDSFV